MVILVSSPPAPNLKGRPRKKKLSISQRRDSQGQAQGQGSSGSTQGSAAVAAQDPCSPDSKTTTKVRLDNIRQDKTLLIPEGKFTCSQHNRLRGEKTERSL